MDEVGAGLNVAGNVAMIVAPGGEEVRGAEIAEEAGADAFIRSGDRVPELENAFKGPVSERQFVVDPQGNTIPVEPGEQLTGSPNGRFLQVRDANGNQTGMHIDGPHNPLGHPDPRAQMSHAHVPGVTNPDGTPWLPINQ